MHFNKIIWMRIIIIEEENGKETFYSKRWRNIFPVWNGMNFDLGNGRWNIISKL